MKKNIFFIILILGLILPFSDSSARVKYKKATRIGMIKDDPSAAEANYTLLQNAIKQMHNVKLNGTFYVKFPKPIILDYTLHITGGEMRIVSGNCFDFVDGGGFVADKTIFKRIDPKEIATLCGGWELYDDILINSFVFTNSTYYGEQILRIPFNDLNSETEYFGIKKIEVCNSCFHGTGRVLFQDGVIWDSCIFKNNKYFKFSMTPIHISYHHSSKRYPEENETYHYVENNLRNSSNVIIDSNEFVGHPVKYDYYYCAALIQSVKCYFTNNTLKNIINYTDGVKLANATCYDAYLSCSEVYFTGNKIENMMSFTMNGGNKPQCEIGKSKINVLAGEGYKTVRHYEDNTYTLDGSYFLNMGADPESLYSNIFNNFDYVDTYNWINNKIVYTNADLAGRSSSAGYGSFNISDNLFQAKSIRGYGLCMMSTADPFNSIAIANNKFVLHEPSVFYLFNQVDKKPNTLSKGDVQIVNNTFVNGIPKISYLIAEDITVKNNNVDAKLEFDSNYYITNYTGADIVPDIDYLSVELPYSVSGNKGNSIVNLSTKSSGTFKYSSPNLSKTKALAGNIYLLNDKSLTFSFTYNKEGEQMNIPVVFDYQNEILSCEFQNKPIKIYNDSYSVIYNNDGVLFHIRYSPSLKKFYYSLTSTNISKNDEGSLIDLQITL